MYRIVEVKKSELLSNMKQYGMLVKHVLPAENGKFMLIIEEAENESLFQK